MNPFADGKRHEMCMDLFVKGFSAPDLITAYHRLTADHEQERLILETACIDEIDDEYNDGETIYPDDDIFEAVTVRRFSQTDSRMKALSRVFTKHLDDGITPGEAIIGKPKKSGLFATVTAQIPFSDGQVISIVFHSPDGNAKQIKPDDAIIAFRWLLNKRDITHVVSPEGEGEVSLEEVGKRITQLVQKNSARFQTTQKEIKEQREKLETLKTEAANLEAVNQQTMDTLRGYQEDIEDTQVKIDRFRGLVERQKEINADLENRLAGLRAAQEAEAARAEAERVAAEQEAAKEREAEEAKLKAEQDAAAEKRRQEIEAEETRIAEYNRLRDVGTTAVPGVRSQDMETAGKLWEMLGRNEITRDEWDRYVEDLYASNKAERPQKTAWESGEKFVLDSFGTNVSSFEGKHLVARDGTEFFFQKGMTKWDVRKWQPAKNNGEGMYLIDSFQAVGDLASYLFKKEARLHPDMSSVPKRKTETESLSGDVRNLPGADNNIIDGFVREDDYMGLFDYAESLKKSALTELNALRDEARSLGWEKEADLLWLAKDVTGLKDLIAVERAARVKKKTKKTSVQETNPAETEALSILNDLLAGKHDSDSDLFGNMLDDAAAKLESLGLMEKHDTLLNSVADYLTGLLEKEAA